MALAVAAALASAGCGDDAGGEGLSSSPGGDGGDGGEAGGGGGSDLTVPEEVVAVEGDPAEVTALDNTFDEQAIRVEAGTTVRWTNRGRQDHDVVPAEGDGWGVALADFAPGQVYEHTFERPGTYHYYCTVHGTETRGMVGVVVVE